MEYKYNKDVKYGAGPYYSPKSYRVDTLDIAVNES